MDLFGSILLTTGSTPGSFFLHDPISANTGELVLSVVDRESVGGKLFIMLNNDTIVNTKEMTLKHTMFLVSLNAGNDTLSVSQHDPNVTEIGKLHVYDDFFENGNTHIKIKLEGEQLSVFVGRNLYVSLF